MPSLNNPNVPSKAKRIASRKKAQKRNAKASRISKNPTRGKVLHPTSGPSAPISAKKARKLERAQGHARQRALEKALAEQGEIVMTDAPKKTNAKSKSSGGEGTSDLGTEKMEVDEVA